MALAPSLTWLFVGRVISGITSASVSTAFAYIADVTPPERRAAVFGKVGVAFGAGFILGPALGGLLGGMDPRLPFWVAAGLSFANTLYGLLILPESLPPDRRSPFRWKRESAGRAASVALRPGAHGVVGGELPCPARACGAALHLRALCDLSLWLGYNDGRSDTGHGRHLLDGGAGCRDRADRAALRRAPGAAAGPWLRRRRLSDLRRGAQQVRCSGSAFP